MNYTSFVECERTRLNRIFSFRLPHSFFNIGMTLCGLSIIFIFIRAFALQSDYLWLKILSQKTMLVGLLIMSISKDKIEDEMATYLRTQSFVIAFVLSVIYALIMPYLEFGISNLIHKGGESYKDLGDFQVLLFMLMIQLMSYQVLKRL